MKHFIVCALTCLFSIGASAQIILTPYVDATVGGLEQNNIDLLENKLRSCISAAEMTSGYNSRFIIAARVNVLDREYTSGAPVRMVQRLSITMAIGDGLSGTCYGSCTFEVKGIGRTEEEAMLSAFKSIPRKNGRIEGMIKESHSRIIQYYEENADNIISHAKSLVITQKYEDALYELSAIPEECSAYPQAVALMSTIYQTNINHDAAQMLSEAQALWSADPNPGPAADQALNILGQINTDAACYGQAKSLMNTIQKRVQSVQDRDYADEIAYRNAQLNAATTLEKARIKAARAIGVAYAQSRPKVVYHVHSWW